MTDDDRWQALAVAMRQEVSRHFPEWTDANAHDPGVTLLQVFAWLTENLMFRMRMSATQDAIVAARHLSSVAAQLAATIGSDQTPAACGAVQRVNYFYGKLLDVEDYRDEQEYVRQRLRRLNRYVHGVGVVTGLAVSVERNGRNACIAIAPGLAIDATGEEIVVPEAVSLPLPSQARPLFIQLRYVERSCKPVPTASPDADGIQYSRIVETYEAFLAPIADPTAVTLAGVRQSAGRWAIVRQRPKRNSRRGRKA